VLAERIEAGARIVATLGQVLPDHRVVTDLESLLTDYRQTEQALRTETDTDRTLARLAVVTERLAPVVDVLVQAERLRAQADELRAQAVLKRADALHRVLTPRVVLACIVALGTLIGGAIGLPIDEIASSWIRPAISQETQP